MTSLSFALKLKLYVVVTKPFAKGFFIGDFIETPHALAWQPRQLGIATYPQV